MDRGISRWKRCLSQFIGFPQTNHFKTLYVRSTWFCIFLICSTSLSGYDICPSPFAIGPYPRARRCRPPRWPGPLSSPRAISSSTCSPWSASWASSPRSSASTCDAATRFSGTARTRSSSYGSSESVSPISISLCSPICYHC